MKDIKTMKSKHLMQMHIGYLPEGMVLEEDLYNYNGKVLLIRAGERITREKIRRIRQFDVNNSQVMVYNDTYLDAVRNKELPEEERQELIENYVGYTKLEETVGDLFSNKNYDAWLKNDTLDPIAQQISERLEDVDPVMVFSCISFPRPMDAELQRHSLNVAFMNGMIGNWLGRSKQDCKDLILAGILHDVGKTRIPEEILNAPRKLTPEEFKQVKEHPIFSDQLLRGKFDDAIRLAARQHHEKMDGSGYPDGLQGTEISKFARITAISDIYDAMVSKRSYKDSRLPFHVFDMFYSGELGKLDPELLGLFLKRMRERYTGKSVVMSDGERGVIEYIPPNDAACPVVRAGARVEQTGEGWYCKEVII